MFFQAHKTLVADDEVVDQFDIEKAARGHELLGRLDVLGGGRRVAAGVVVAENEARAVADDRGAEDLRDAHDRAIDGALIAADLLDQLALGVQQQDDHLFSVKVRHVQHHQVRRVHWCADLVPGLRLQQAEPAPNLQGCLHLRRFRLPHAVFGT